MKQKIDRRANAVFGILCTAQKDARADLWQMAAASAKSVPERVEAVLQNRWRPCVTAVQQCVGHDFHNWWRSTRQDAKTLMWQKCPDQTWASAPWHI